MQLEVCTGETVSQLENVKELHHKDEEKALSLPIACALFFLISTITNFLWIAS